MNFTKGILLGSGAAAASQLVWLVGVLLGAPWSQSANGMALLASPGLGFCAGMVLQAACTSALGSARRPPGRFLALAAGQVVMWLTGWSWLALGPGGEGWQASWPLVASQTAGLPGFLAAWALLAWVPWPRRRIGTVPKPAQSPEVIR